MYPILSNRAPAPAFGDGSFQGLESFTTGIRAEFLQAPPPSTALLAQLAATAAEAGSVSRLASTEITPVVPTPSAGRRERPAGRRERRAPRLRRPALAARIALAALSVPMLLTGLAFAGVTLPAPARDLIESIGVTLPNQPDEAGSAGRDAGGDAITGPGGQGAGRGSENGQTKSANGKGKDHDGRPGNPVGPSAKGESKGVARGPNPAPGTPRGQGSGAPPDHSNAGGKAERS